MSFGIAAFLNNETKVNREALVTGGGFHCGCCTRRSFAHFGCQANGASIKFGRERQFGKPFYETVHVGKASEVEVA